MELYWERTDLTALLSDVASSLEPVAAQRENRLVVDGEGLTTGFVDATKLRQVLINLISNACKFSESSDVTIRGERSSNGGSDEVAFHVIDRGIGIDDETLSRLFQAFTQADASTTRQYGGTGLGLVISKRFTELMGGRIEVRSTPGEGSTFSVYLPLHAKQPLRPSRPVPRNTLPPRLDGGDLVLVADDDLASRELTARLAQKMGYRIESAASMDEAIAKAKMLKPAALTLDVDGWKGGGWALLEELKENGSTGEIPIVVVSASDDRERAVLLGGDAFVGKPTDRDTLAKALRPFAKPTKP